MNTGLKMETQKKIFNLFKNYKEVELVYLFGSRATGSFRNGSDIDLAVSGKNLTTKYILDIQESLYNLNLPYRFDIVNLQVLDNERMRKDILQNGIIIFRKITDKVQT